MARSLVEPLSTSRFQPFLRAKHLNTRRYATIMSTQAEVKPDPIREVFDELFTFLETLETNNAAVLQFLQDQGIGGEKLAPYLERAGNASNVKMRAARKRMEYLLTPIQKEATTSNKEQEKERETEQDKEKREAKPEDG